MLMMFGVRLLVIFGRCACLRRLAVAKRAHLVAMAALNLSTADASTWMEHLQAYPCQIQALDNPKLVALDDFYTRSLPPLIQKRLPSPFITREELSKIMEWKLTRGKWRPKLLSFVSSLDDEEVKTVSQKAFSALPDLKEAITLLSALKGVGPATASAILAAFAPEIAPFMSDEAIGSVLGGVKDYSLKQYLLLAEKLQRKSKDLKECAGSENLQFTPSDLEKALWVATTKKKLSEVSKKGVKVRNQPVLESSKDKRRKKT